MADVLSLIIKADNAASPELEKVVGSIKRLETATKAWGTGTQEARTATSKLFDQLRQSRGASDAASGGLGGVNQAAKDLAKGGMRDLLSEVPLVGGALSKLAGTLGGFPLLLGGIVGAGLGVLKFLQGLGQEADRALASISKLSAEIGTNFQQTVLESQRLQAEAAGDRARAVELSYQKEIAATAAKVEAVKLLAQQEADALDLFGRRRGTATQETLNALQQAEADHANNVILQQTKLAIGLKAVEDERVKAATEAREKEVQAAEAAAAKQQKLIEDLTASSLATFKQLGAGFEDVVKSLELAQFVSRTQAAIAELNQGIELGIDTHGRFAAGVAALQTRMDEAIRLGYVPTIEKTKELAAETQKTAEVAEDAGLKWLRSMEGISATLDEIIAKTRAARAASSSVGSGGASQTVVTSSSAGGSSGPTGDRVLDSTVLEHIVNQPSGSGLTPLTEFQHGGLVPGSGPVPILAHGGEAVIPAGLVRALEQMARNGGSTRPTVVNLSVTQSGTVIQQDRDWQTYIALLRQELGLR